MEYIRRDMGRISTHISKESIDLIINRIWEQFNYRTQMMKGLFAYESAFRAYTRACIQDFADDNIQYAEIRPNFMYSNSLKSDDGEKLYENRDIVRIIEEELKAQKAEINAMENQYFGGMKVIYCTPRSFSNEDVKRSLIECIDLKTDFPDLICGKMNAHIISNTC